MATLNLGRIKPVFRGAYSGSTAYVVDDIVTHGNESFICIQAHGAGTQATSVTAYWTKLAAKGTDGTDVGTTITTQGDVLYRDGSGLQRLAKPASNKFLQNTSGGVLSWEDAGGGKLLQNVSVTKDAVATSSASGIPSTITNGGQLFTNDFTPTSATSTILVMTSTISISEEANSANIPWLALWNGSTFVAAQSGHGLDSRYAGSLLSENHSLCHTFAAGSTSQRAIQVRGGIDGGTAYLNGASSANYTGSSARISMIIQEIGA